MVQSLDAFPSPRARLALATFTLGAYAQVAQALLVRETLLVFYGNEVSLGAFYGGWLLWVAVGAAAAVAVRGRAAGPRALSWLRRLLVLMPALLAGQVLVPYWLSHSALGCQLELTGTRMINRLGPLTP